MPLTRTDAELIRALHDAERRASRTLGEIGPGIAPYVSEQHRYTTPAREVPWTAGFWAGIALLLRERTSDPEERRALDEQIRARRRDIARNLDPEGPPHNHDLGFQHYLSAAAAADLLSDEEAEEQAVRAARLLAARWTPHGRYIQAHGPLRQPREGGRMIIDAMMNLPLLFWASGRTGDESLRTVARAHAETSLHRLLRPDGSVAQAYDFAGDGTPLGEGTIQGVGPSSTWTRGQAWAIYGFAIAAEALPDDRYRAASIAAAEAFLRRNGGAAALAPWDFDAAEPETAVRDASANAIAAGGLLRLARIDDSRAWEELAREMILHTARAAKAPAASHGLIGRSCYHLPAGSGLDECTAWGDYFFLETLVRLSGGTGLYDLIGAS